MPVSADFIRDLERQRVHSLAAPDAAFADRLHALDYELITPGGVAISRESYLGRIENGELTYRTFEPASEIRVRLYRNAAVVRYRAQIEVAFSGEIDSGVFWHTDLYETRDGNWQAVWSDATRSRRD